MPKNDKTLLSLAEISCYPFFSPVRSGFVASKVVGHQQRDEKAALQRPCYGASRNKIPLIKLFVSVPSACNISVDPMFVIDGGNLPMKKNFMKALVDKLYVDINETQIGIILSRGPAEIPLPADLPFGRTESSDAVKEFF